VGAREESLQMASNYFIKEELGEKVKMGGNGCVNRREE
jgi:hypothetical protein